MQAWDLNSWTREYRPQVGLWTVMVNGQDMGAVYHDEDGTYSATLSGAEALEDEPLPRGFLTRGEAADWVRRQWALIWSYCTDCGEEISREQAERSVGLGEDAGARCATCLGECG